MIEYHGWITINQSVDGENEDRIQQIVFEVLELFKKHTIENESYQYSESNGLYFIHFSGSHNHNGDQLNKLRDLLKEVGCNAPGSYGILFFKDDENKEYNNEFQIFKLLRGEVKFERDKYLSPCNPLIEE